MDNQSKTSRCSVLFFIFCSLGILCSTGLWSARKLIGEGAVLRPKATAEPPKIDGVLDDAAWASGPIITEPYTVNFPVYGERLPQETKVWITYDPDNIYFAFYCYDDEPDKIKATVSRRDSILDEDWVGVDLDTVGKRQVTREFICNPLGIQADLLNSASGGETAEPDWVWYSAGKVVKDGYIVEMRIPLKSIPFKSGKNVTMTMATYRVVSRTGSNASWPQISEKRGYFNSLVPVIFERLDKQLRLEALPSMTYGSLWDRQSPRQWSGADDSSDLGIGIKYGITSSISAEATVNPDFSQVESDEFQVVANQRFPTFFSEKRPFFMEVKNQFNLAGTGGDMNMNTAVHTRRIIDPEWGGKLTGEAGKASFGILAAGDEFPGRAWGSGENPFPGQNATYMIGRLKYSLKGDNYLGFIYSGREFGDESNRVVGGDFRHRFKGNHNISFNGLYSFSKDSDQSGEKNGGAFTLRYGHSKKALGLEFFLEHYDEDFRMDTAFFLRRGITKFTGYIGPNFYPNRKKLPWFRKFNPFIWGYYVHDHATGMDDFFILGALRFNFTQQGYLRLDIRHNEESWAGRKFKLNSFRGQGGVRLAKWLDVSGAFVAGPRIFYDPENPFKGNSTSIRIAAGIQPNSRFRQGFTYIHQKFNRAENGERVFDLNILISKTTYQFNKYLFIRGLVQYDSFQQIVLSDMLASFTLIPGTVVHLGYGSLHEKQNWNPQNLSWEQRVGLSRYYQTTQSLFFKVSYLYRF
ncbi:MAG: carbohydrate binding family 9 domain-containing protein [bacterium]|nr:carbohydrate binding family 9 domain-containing protein [bacterium]